MDLRRHSFPRLHEAQEYEMLDASEKLLAAFAIGRLETRKPTMTEARIMITTLDNRELADSLAHQLLESHLAACVNIVERVRSIYRWEGRIESAEEFLLIVKTADDRIPALQDRVLQVHPYKVPEFIVFRAEEVSEAYLDWLVAATRP